jgi:uncharacterized protein YukE
MLPGGGGGSTISVETAALDTMAGQISRIAGDTSSARGGLGHAAGAAAGCQEPAADTFTRLQTLLSGAMQCLDDCSLALARAVSQASAAYVTTDATQMSAGGRATPR